MFWSLFSDDPYKDYNEEKLFKYLPRTRPAAKAGERYDYSNFGAGLLGCVLARKLGMNYEAALRQRVLAPLGLADTKIVLSDSDKARLALGHDESQKPTSNWHFTDALAGAGALRSTVRDQLKYLKANLDPSSITDVHLRNAVTNTHRQRHSVGKNMGVALGWHLSRKKPDSQPIIWHNGGTGGYHSFVGFVAGKKAGVVLLANTSSGHVDVAANEVLEILIRESTP
jgi:CubicO group peptidase (beta-lactamase class C family)